MTRDEIQNLKRGDWVELEYQREAGKVRHFGARGVTKPIVKSQRGAAATEYAYLAPQERYYHHENIRRKAAALTDEEIGQALLARRMKRRRSARFKEHLKDAIRDQFCDLGAGESINERTNIALQIVLNLLAEEGRIPTEGWRAWYRCSEEAEIRYLHVPIREDGIAQVQELKNYAYTKEFDPKFGDVEIAECGLEVCAGGIWVEWLSEGKDDVHDVIYDGEMDHLMAEEDIPEPDGDVNREGDWIPYPWGEDRNDK